MICKKKKKTARILVPKRWWVPGICSCDMDAPAFSNYTAGLQIFEEGTCCLSPSLPSPTTMWGIARELAAHATDAEGGNAGGGEESSSFKQQIEIPLAVSAFFPHSVVARGSRILFSFFDPGVVVLVLRRVNHPLPLCVGLGCVGTYCASWVATRESAIRENLVGNVFCCCQGSDNGQPAMAVSVVLVQQAPPKSGAKG